MNPTFPLVPIANFFACILVLASLSKNIFQSWNVGAISLIVWTITLALITGINAIIWSNGVQNVAPVWCDITTHIWMIGIDSTIPAVSFVMVRRLYIAMCRSGNSPLQKDKSSVIIDLSLCIGCPLISLVIYSVLKIHRYEIIEEIGCIGSPAPFGLSLLLICFPAALAPLASLVLYCLIIRAYFRHRKELKATQLSSTSSNRHGFSRLATIWILDVILVPPLLTMSLIMLILEAKDVPFWPGWSAIHTSDFWTIPVLTSEEWKSAGIITRAGFGTMQWICPFVSLYIFALYGLTEHKQDMYRSIFRKLMRPLGLKPHMNVEHSVIAFEPGHQINLPTDDSMTTTTTITRPPSISNTDSDNMASFDKTIELEEGRCGTFRTARSAAASFIDNPT